MMNHEPCDLSQVRGHAAARRALEVAAVGDHPIALIGPRGAGKSLLARCLPGLLPPLTSVEAEEVAAIHGTEPPPSARPLRRPDFGTRPAGMLGTLRRPGEVSLAHGGVLALDDLPCFSLAAVRTLLQPLDFGEVRLNRGGSAVRRPARFLLVVGLRACPCGDLARNEEPCACTPGELRRHLRPVEVLADRLALWVWLPALPFGELQSCRPGESSGAVQARVLAARARLATLGADEAGRLGAPSCRLLDRAEATLRLSPREARSVLRVARSVACLAGSRAIRPEHVSEALQYRCFGRPGRREPLPESGSRARAIVGFWGANI